MIVQQWEQAIRCKRYRFYSDGYRTFFTEEDIVANIDTFMTVYERHLRQNHADHPNMYAYTVEGIPNVLSRVRAAVLKGAFSKDTPTFKATLKELKIKDTYTAIAAYIGSP